MTPGQRELIWELWGELLRQYIAAYKVQFVLYRDCESLIPKRRARLAREVMRFRYRMREALR